MLQAFGLLVCVAVAFWAFAPGAALPWPLILLLIAAAALAAWRLSDLRNEASPARAPAKALFLLSRWPAALVEALACARAAISADVRLRPALVRVRMRPTNAMLRAAAAESMALELGAVLVDIDERGCLLHVLDEERGDVAGLHALETQAHRIGGGRASS